MSSVALRGVVKRYGQLEVVHSVDLAIEEGEFVVLLGPSGCGKTTTLRMVAGLEDISAGEVEIAGRVVNTVAPKDRQIAMVFQNYALYPHMTVRQNMEFALKPQRLSTAEVKSRIAEAVRILGLDVLLDRKPSQLSGGQRQRVAMGRAMVRTPKVFLFDEPLSNLDAKLRNQVRLEIAKLHKRLGTTILYVTHDQIEAMTLADKIVIMKDGYIEQVGSPEEVFARPRNLFVATFIGSPSMNLVPAVVQITGKSVKLAAGPLTFDAPSSIEAQLRAGQKVTLGIRPSEITLVPDHASGLEASIEVTEYLGTEALLNLRIGEQDLCVQIPASSRPPLGQPTVRIDVDSRHLHVFDTESGLAILA